MGYWLEMAQAAEICSMKIAVANFQQCKKDNFLF